MSWILSLDCGKQRDHSVLGAIDCYQRLIDPNLPDEFSKRYLRKKPEKVVNHYRLRGLKRYPLGMNYEELADDVVRATKIVDIMGDFEVVVDAGGVGLAVMDALKIRGLDPIGVMLKASGEVTFNNGIYRVEKEHAVFTFVGELQSGKISVEEDILSRPEGKQLVHEMESFVLKRRESGSTKLEAAREEDHDDEIMMFIQGVWYASQTQFQELSEGPVEPSRQEQEQENAYNPLTWRLP